jgi:hypothetical protein
VKAHPPRLNLTPIPHRHPHPPKVEILLPEFWDPISGPIFPNKGDQERFWRMTRRFVEALAANTGSGGVKAVRHTGGPRLAPASSGWLPQAAAGSRKQRLVPASSHARVLPSCLAHPWVACSGPSSIPLPRCTPTRAWRQC